MYALFQEDGIHLAKYFSPASSSLVLGLLANLSSPIPQYSGNIYHVITIIKCLYHRSNAHHDS